MLDRHTRGSRGGASVIPRMLSMPRFAALLVGALGWVAGASMAAVADQPAPIPVFDPGMPGPSVPPVGRSVFDDVVASPPGEPRVPYPFDALIARIERHLARMPSQTSMKRLLIPFGRSLQRSAAAPHYLEFPRLVVAVDGEPSSSSPLLLKDRLYVAFQERADQIEVISYNDAAGRFEFQLVRDYAPGRSPQLVYANRALCTSCHQNGGPIFSRPTWDETSANPRVAAQLRSRAGERFGVDLASGIDVANDFSDAVHRANAFAAAQLLWREGCGDDPVVAQRCRAALFRAMLAFRLSGRSRGHVASAPLAEFEASAHKRWPQGLALPESDIPNRNPLESASPAAVETAFDPLLARGPSQAWPTTDASIAARTVEALSEFVSDADVERLDRALVASRAGASPVRSSLRVPCEVRQGIASASRATIDFHCANRRDARADLEVDASAELASGGIEVALTRVRWHGGSLLLDGSLRDARVVSQGRSMTGVPQRGPLAARDANGDAIERITLSWSGASGETEIVSVDDSARLDRAVDALLSDGLHRAFGGFAMPTFRRAALIPPLLARLGSSGNEGCCREDIRPTGAPVADAHAAFDSIASGGAEASELAPFFRHCAVCHSSSDPAPANFLWGNPATVRQRIAQCAPRIYVRLAMWRAPLDPHAKTPMPPQVALARHGLAPDAWRDSADFGALLGYAESQATGRTGRPPDAAHLHARDYDALPPCLQLPGDHRGERTP
ncbi:MAG TPA: hypothetical protein VGI14_07075 [Casimicrobiaceae bacterium]